MTLTLTLALYIGGMLGTFFVVAKYNPPQDLAEYLWAGLVVLFWPVLWLALFVFVIMQEFIAHSKGE